MKLTPVVPVLASAFAMMTAVEASATTTMLLDVSAPATGSPSLSPDDLAAPALSPDAGQTFTVTQVGAEFSFNGGPLDPTLNLTAGDTYIFNLSGLSEPLGFKTSFSPSGQDYVGANPNDVSSGSITLDIPATGFPDAIFYVGDIHGTGGTINIVPAPEPVALPLLLIGMVVAAGRRRR
jgi:hypothetical protein